MIREYGEAFKLKNKTICSISKGREDSKGNVIDTSPHMIFPFVGNFINFAAHFISHRKNRHWNYTYGGDAEEAFTGPLLQIQGWIMLPFFSKLNLDDLFHHVTGDVQHSIVKDQIWQPWGLAMRTNGWSTCLRCTTFVLWSLVVTHLSQSWVINCK